MVDRNLNDRIDFGKAVSFFAERKVYLQPQRLLIHLPNAKEILDAGLQHFLGSSYKWLPEYDNVADWLTDNNGQGLFCMGNCGRGKTTIACKYFPAFCNTIFTKYVPFAWHVK